MAVAFCALRQPFQFARAYKDSFITSLSERVTSCTTALRESCASYLNGSPFRKSIVGRMALGLGFETVGALVGASIGGPVMGAACRHLSPLFVVAGIAGVFYSLKGRATLGVAAAFCEPSRLSAISSIFGMTALGMGGAGIWIGTNIGMVLGGYAGLYLFGSRVRFWDQTDRGDTYVAAMARSIAFGEMVRGAPLIRPVVQMIGYNLGSVLGIFRALFRERELRHKVIIPLLVKSFCGKYCETNAPVIGKNLARLLSRTVGVVPWIEEQVRFIAGLPFIQDCIQSRIKISGDNSHKVAAALMRSFVEYVELVKTSEMCKQAEGVHQLELALKKEISGNVVETFYSLSPLEKLIKSLVQNTLTSIEEWGVDLYGTSIPIDKEKMHPLLTVHMKYFFIYFLFHYDFSLLDAVEEENFMSTLTKSFVSLFSLPCCSHKVFRLLGRVMNGPIVIFFFIKRQFGYWMEQPEQRALMDFDVELPPELGSTRPVHVFGHVDLSQYEQVTRASAVAAVDDHKVEVAILPALAAVAESPMPKRPIHRLADVGHDYEQVSKEDTVEDDQEVSEVDFEALTEALSRS